MKPIRVLVTGGGSGVGQGIIKALRISSLPITIICADIAPLNAGLYRADEAVLIPKVETEGSLGIINSIVEKKRIDVVMVGSEYDLTFFSKNKACIESQTGALVVASPLKTVQIADDKWLTAEFLRHNNLPHAEAYIPEDIGGAINKAKEWGYPLVLKARSGTSNRHVHIIHEEHLLRSLFEEVPMPMMQRLISMPRTTLENEYTCSVFKSKDGTILGPFTARRTLRSGSSWVAEVNNYSDLHPLLIKIGQVLPIMGSINIQLMLGPDGPVPFELNARFSGTTAIRAHFGFNEPEMVLQNYYLGETLPEPVIRKGITLRYLEEIFLDDALADELESPLKKGVIERWF